MTNNFRTVIWQLLPFLHSPKGFQLVLMVVIYVNLYMLSKNPNILSFLLQAYEIGGGYMGLLTVRYST